VDACPVRKQRHHHSEDGRNSADEPIFSFSFNRHCRPAGLEPPLLRVLYHSIGPHEPQAALRTLRTTRVGTRQAPVGWLGVPLPGTPERVPFWFRTSQHQVQNPTSQSQIQKPESQAAQP